MRERARALILAVTAAVAVMFASGCGEEEDSCCALPPKEIAYSVGGGFPPFAQRLTIGEDNRARLVTEDFRGPRRSIEFSADPGSAVLSRSCRPTRRRSASGFSG